MSATVVRAIRGATTVESDDEESIRKACGELFSEMLARNGLDDEALISVIVTTTADLTSMFPARAIREECGLHDVPLMGATEAQIEGGTPMAIRVLAHVNTTMTRAEISHVFQGRAAALRPDIAPS